MLSTLSKSRSFAALSAVIVLAGAAASVHATGFTAGDVLVYRVGDGSAALGTTAAAVFVDEFSPTGTLVQTVAMPTVTGGGNFALTSAGSSTAEGFLNFSPDGSLLTLTGYDAPTGTTGLAASASTLNPRDVAIIPTSTGLPSITTALTDFATGSSPRGAVTTDGTNLWIEGGAGGARFTTTGSTTSTQLSTTVTNLRAINIFNGQLYTSDASGSAVRLGTIGTGLPTTAGQTITNLPGFLTSTGSPYQFVLFDESSSVAGLDTLYVADDGSVATNGGIQKWLFNGTTWTLSGILLGSNGDKGLSATFDGTNVTLYAATAAGLFSYTDTTGFAPLTAGATDTLIASAGTNTAFRGIAIVPGSGTPTPEPASLGLLAVGGLALLARRRKA